MGVELRHLNQGEPVRPACGQPNQTKPPSCTNQSNMCLERHQELRRTTEKKPRKLLRPRLPRKITTTCKINLNKFWEELEEVYRDTTTANVLPMWPADSMVEEEQQNNENEEREKMEVKLPSGRLDRYVFLLPSLPLPSRASESSLPLEPLLVIPVCDSITC